MSIVAGVKCDWCGAIRTGDMDVMVVKLERDAEERGNTHEVYSNHFCNHVCLGECIESEGSFDCILAVEHLAANRVVDRQSVTEILQELGMEEDSAERMVR